MKKLYAYSGELERRIDRLDEADSNDIVRDMLLEQMSITEDITLGDFTLKMLSYMFEIPEDCWSKTKDELDPEIIKMLLEKVDNECTIFVQE